MSQMINCNLCKQPVHVVLLSSFHFSMSQNSIQTVSMNYPNSIGEILAMSQNFLKIQPMDVSIHRDVHAQPNEKKSFRFRTKSFGSNTDTVIGPQFQFPTLKPSLGCTLVYIEVRLKSNVLSNQGFKVQCTLIA